MTYQVLTPIYERTGQYTHDGREFVTVTWKVLGLAKSMKEAKKMTRYPVLEEVRVH